MKKLLFLFTLLSIFLQKGVFAIPTYTCGYQDNGTVNVATLWIEEDGAVKAISLSSASSQALKIIIYQNKIYMIGFTVSDPNLNATLWKTDLIGNNVEEIQLAGSGSSAYDATIYNNQLYVVGNKTISSKAFACLWKLNLNGAILLENAFGNETSLARSITIASNKIYIGGKVNATPQAALWIGDLSGNNISNVYTNNTESRIDSTMVYKNQLYLAGFTGNAEDSTIRATLWIGNLDGSGIRTINLSNEQSEALDLNVFNDVIYASGDTIISGHYDATIWKISLAGSLISNFNLSNSFSAYSFTFFNNSILAVGASTDLKATLWNTSLDGIDLSSPTRLGTLSNISISASIAINASSALTLGRALSEFSPVKPQKGIK